MTKLKYQQIIIQFFSFFLMQKINISRHCKTVTVSKIGSQRHYDLFTMSPKAVQHNTKNTFQQKFRHMSSLSTSFAFKGSNRFYIHSFSHKFNTLSSLGLK